MTVCLDETNTEIHMKFAQYSRSSSYCLYFFCSFNREYTLSPASKLFYQNNCDYPHMHAAYMCIDIHTVAVIQTEEAYEIGKQPLECIWRN